MPQLVVIPGDGIGLEVVPAATAVLRAVIPQLDTIEAEAGWNCFQKHGVSVPEATLAAIRESGASLFGAVSSPNRQVVGYRSAILTMRQELDLYANIRPVKSWPNVSPRPGIDMIIVRENTEGLYSGRERIVDATPHPETQNPPAVIVQTAVAERVITRRASLRIGKRALEIMQAQGRQKLTIVHKANVLPLTDGLFRDCVREVLAAETPRRPEWTVDELLVDVAALKMVAEPERFDVIVTTNLFGDILSDAAAYWGGGLGMAPSLNWGEACAVAEPVHGSAPDIAGRGIANPIAAILSGALLARTVWGLAAEAEAIETAVTRVLAHQPNLQGTQAIATAVVQALP